MFAPQWAMLCGENGTLVQYIRYPERIKNNKNNLFVMCLRTRRQNANETHGRIVQSVRWLQ